VYVFLLIIILRKSYVGPDGIRAREFTRNCAEFVLARGVSKSARNLVYARNLSEKAKRFIINCELDKMTNKD
jgi:hypothetical protein